MSSRWSSMPAPEWTPPEPRPVNIEEARRLDLYAEISQTLAEQTDLKSAFRAVLQLMCARRPGRVVGGAVIVRSDGGDDVELHVAEGTWVAPSRGTRDTHTDVTDRVITTGRPVVIARVSAAASRRLPRDPDAAAEVSRVAAPIVVSGRPTGVVAIDYRFTPERDLHRSLSYVGLLASMAAQAVAALRRTERALQDETGGLPTKMQDLRFRALVGTSGPLGDVHAQVAQVAPSNTTVLLRGESGTGKGLIAQAIHHNSPRASKRFVTVSCAALPPDLIEAELFGYEKGAFTGAQAFKKGRLELANGGTLFLDEIGELSLDVQVKLLRVLQAREFERLGGTQTIPLDVRIVAATNRNLEKAIAAGGFREDLYYRLNVFSIFVPPLRDRKADVLLLADHFLEKFAREHAKPVRRISTPAIDMLTSYHWPGNVRELANAIERALVICDGGVIHAHHLPPTLQTAESSETVAHLSLEDMVAAVEKDALMDALKTARGNRATAARLLRTTRRIFNYKVRNYGIDWRRFVM